MTQISSAMLQVNQGAQTSSQQSEELASTASEFARLAGRLRVEVSRFTLREQQAPKFDIAGMTPEMLRQVAELVRARIGDDSGPAEAKTQVVATEKEKEKSGIELPLDRDERGYGEF